MNYACMYGLEEIKIRSKEEAKGLRGSCLGEEQVCTRRSDVCKRSLRREGLSVLKEVDETWILCLLCSSRRRRVRGAVYGRRG